MGYALDEYNQALIPEAVIEALDRIKQDIIAGRIEVPASR